MKPEKYRLFAVLAALFLTACVSAEQRERPTSESIARALAERPARNQATRRPPAGIGVADLAMQMVGIPYRYGGMTPEQGFDCSGLVHYSYARNGISVPRTSQAQFDASRKISLSQAGAGDLLFFSESRKISHVGIYLGDGRFVHAPTTGRTVSIGELDNRYYREHLVAVGRLMPE